MTVTTTVEQSEKAQEIGKWLNALVSGEYEQTNGTLCTVNVKNGQKKYCCVGVLDEVLLGTGWHPAEDAFMDDENQYMYDDDGETGLVSAEKVAHLDLDLPVTQYEALYLESLPLVDTGTFERPTSRITALAMLNDREATFKDIVEVVQYLNWDK